MKIKLVQVNAHKGLYTTVYESGITNVYTDSNVPSTVIRFIQQPYIKVYAQSSAVKTYYL